MATVTPNIAGANIDYGTYIPDGVRVGPDVGQIEITAYDPVTNTPPVSTLTPQFDKFGKGVLLAPTHRQTLSPSDGIVFAQFQPGVGSGYATLVAPPGSGFTLKTGDNGQNYLELDYARALAATIEANALNEVAALQINAEDIYGNLLTVQIGGPGCPYVFQDDQRYSPLGTAPDEPIAAMAIKKIYFVYLAYPAGEVTNSLITVSTTNCFGFDLRVEQPFDLFQVAGVANTAPATFFNDLGYQAAPTVGDPAPINFMGVCTEGSEDQSTPFSSDPRGTYAIGEAMATALAADPMKIYLTYLVNGGDVGINQLAGWQVFYGWDYDAVTNPNPVWPYLNGKAPRGNIQYYTTDLVSV